MKYSLVGIDGNAYSVMGYVSNAMKECGFTKDAINEYRAKAMSSDYINLLRVSLDYTEMCNIIYRD